MKDFLSIQEFSQISGIAVTTLRFWDDIGIFSPQKRDPDNNYRYYSPEQQITIKFITVLSDLAVPLKKIGAAKKNRDPKAIMELIALQEKKMQTELRKLRMRLSIIFTRREMMRYGVEVDETEVAIMHREDLEYILGPRNEYKDGETFQEALIRFCQAAEKLRIDLSLPIGGYHDNMESFLKNPNKPDYFFSMDPIGNCARVAGDYLIGFERGYYGKLRDVSERMSAYAKDKSLTFSGPVYVLYLHDEICIEDPSQYLAQVCVAVSKQKRKR